jgi:hypothetical protein
MFETLKPYCNIKTHISNVFDKNNPTRIKYPTYNSSHIVYYIDNNDIVIKDDSGSIICYIRESILYYVDKYRFIQCYSYTKLINLLFQSVCKDSNINCSNKNIVSCVNTNKGINNNGFWNDIHTYYHPVTEDLVLNFDSDLENIERLQPCSINTIIYNKEYSPIYIFRCQYGYTTPTEIHLKYPDNTLLSFGVLDGKFHYSYIKKQNKYIVIYNTYCGGDKLNYILSNNYEFIFEMRPLSEKYPYSIIYSQNPISYENMNSKYIIV